MTAAAAGISSIVTIGASLVNGANKSFAGGVGENRSRELVYTMPRRLSRFCYVRSRRSKLARKLISAMTADLFRRGEFGLIGICNRSQFFLQPQFFVCSISSV